MFIYKVLTKLFVARLWATAIGVEIIEKTLNHRVYLANEMVLCGFCRGSKKRDMSVRRD